MKHHPAIVALATIASVLAGTPAPQVTPAPADPWIKPLIDIRVRYEYGDQENLKAAHSLTTRERFGLVTADWHGFSALVQGEFTQAIVDDYTVLQPGMTPFDPRYTPIGDPETNELNQAYFQYRNWDTVFRAGRQQIVLDGAQLVGDVIWRQNQQTYDAFSITNTSVEDLTLFYSYANRANRIFGSDAVGFGRSFAGDMHFFNAKYAGIGSWTGVGYAYLMDFDETAPPVDFVSNNTYGLFFTGPAGPLTLYAEFAFQTDTGSSSPTRPDEAYYTHLTASINAGSHKFTLGWEYLDHGFVTPLSTVHKFNGFADAFIGRRIGLGGGNPGLSDVYLSHSTPLPFWGLNFTQAFHLFGDNGTAFDYGWEYDAVLTKKFNENFLALAKFASFDASGRTPQANNGPLFDTTRLTVELNYTY